MADGDGTTCLQCGHAAGMHDGEGGICTGAGCGCTRFWDRGGFDGAMDLMDLGDAPAIPDRDD